MISPIAIGSQARSLVAGFMLGILVVGQGCASRDDHQSSAPPPGEGVLLIGLDGATWSLIHPWIVRGSLPNFERLRREGAWGTLESMEPMASPRIWTTIATGRQPEDHGVLGFYRKDDDGRLVTYTNLDRRSPAIWNILSARDRASTVVGWFTSWPVDVIPGAMISDRSEGPLPGGHFPPELETILARFAQALSDQEVARQSQRFLGPALDPSLLTRQEERSSRALEESLEQYYRVDRLRLEWTLELMREQPTELTAVFFKGIDSVSHLAWIHMDPDSFDSRLRPARQVQRHFQPLILRYYEFMDEAIGALLKATPPNTDIIIVSDHGFNADRAPTVKLAYHLDPVLAKLGWLVLDDDDKPDPDRSLVVDPTQHWQEPRLARRFRVNSRLLAQRSEEGDERKRQMAMLEERLARVRTSLGEPLFEEVASEPLQGDGTGRPEDLYLSARINGKLAAASRTSDGWVISGHYEVDGKQYPLSDLMNPRVEHTGSHRLDGVILMAGPRIQRGVRIAGARIHDVAPTVLRLLGLPRSREMPGRVLAEALRQDLLPPQAPAVATHDSGEPIRRVEIEPRSPQLLDQEEKLQKQLRALGYVD
jgi:predicted AlkP superfamily phosphohydrolase/phosphomutase